MTPQCRSMSPGVLRGFREFRFRDQPAPDVRGNLLDQSRSISYQNCAARSTEAVLTCLLQAPELSVRIYGVMAHVHATGLFTRNDPAGTSLCAEVYGKMKNGLGCRSREPRRSTHQPTATNISKIKLLKLSISAFLVRHIRRQTVNEPAHAGMLKEIDQNVV